MNQSDELSIIVSDTSFVTHLHIATIVLIYIHVAPWLMHIPRSTNSIQCSQLISDTLFFSLPTLHFYTIMIVSYISFLDFPRLLHLPPVRTNCRLTAPTQPVEVCCWILLKTQGYVLHINCYHPYVCLTLDLFFSLSLLQQAICTNI